MTVPLNDLVTLAGDAVYADEWRPAFTPTAHLVEIDAGSVTQAADLFANATAALELPEGAAIRKWSGFEDRLWESISTTEREVVVIVLRHADALLAGQLAVLLEAVSVFTTIAHGFADRSSDPKSVFIVLTGAGPNFP